MPGSSMGNRRSDAFIDQPALAEAVETEGRGDRMRPVIGNGIGEDEARTGNGLEAAGAPAAVHVETLYIGEANDGRAVARHVNETAPHAHHAQAGNDREGLNQG